jgi:hypothetical protein
VDRGRLDLREAQLRKIPDLRADPLDGRTRRVERLEDVRLSTVDDMARV